MKLTPGAIYVVATPLCPEGIRCKAYRHGENFELVCLQPPYGTFLFTANGLLASGDEAAQRVKIKSRES